MFSRFLIVALASLALACGIALVCFKLLGASGDRKKVPIRSVVVASSDLPVGTRIRVQDVRVAGVPVELAPQNCFEKIDDVRDRVVINLVLKDEPVVTNRLAVPGSAPGLAPLIPAGFRAVSVRVNDVIGVAGFIQPGMRVDVLASGRVPNSDDSITRTVLQNVMVLSAGQVLQPDAKGQAINAQVVTLQVRPDEAEILALTSGEGKIQLVLRNSADHAVGPTPGAHLVAIYNAGGSNAASRPAPPAVRRVDPPAATPLKTIPAQPSPPPVPSRTIEVIRGTTRSDVTTPNAARHSDAQSSGDPEKKKVTRVSHATSPIA